VASRPFRPGVNNGFLLTNAYCTTRLLRVRERHYAYLTATPSISMR